VYPPFYAATCCLSSTCVFSLHSSLAFWRRESQEEEEEENGREPSVSLCQLYTRLLATTNLMAAWHFLCSCSCDISKTVATTLRCCYAAQHLGSMPIICLLCAYSTGGTYGRRVVRARRRTGWRGGAIARSALLPVLKVLAVSEYLRHGCTARCGLRAPHLFGSVLSQHSRCSHASRLPASRSTRRLHGALYCRWHYSRHLLTATQLHLRST